MKAKRLTKKQKLKVWRMQNKIRAYKVAEYIGITKSAYSKYENDKINLKQSNLLRLLEFQEKIESDKIQVK